MFGTAIRKCFYSTGIRTGNQIDNPFNKEVFKTKEVARICDVTAQTVKNWIYQGRIKALATPGGHHRVSRKELEHFLGR